MAKPDLSDLDRIDPDIVERLGPWWQRVYAALKGIREVDGKRDG